MINYPECIRQGKMGVCPFKYYSPNQICSTYPIVYSNVRMTKGAHCLSVQSSEIVWKSPDFNMNLSPSSAKFVRYTCNKTKQNFVIAAMWDEQGNVITDRNTPACNVAIIGSRKCSRGRTGCYLLGRKRNEGLNNALLYLNKIINSPCDNFSEETVVCIDVSHLIYQSSCSSSCAKSDSSSCSKNSCNVPVVISPFDRLVNTLSTCQSSSSSSCCSKSSKCSSSSSSCCSKSSSSSCCSKSSSSSSCSSSSSSCCSKSSSSCSSSSSSSSSCSSSSCSSSCSKSSSKSKSCERRSSETIKEKANKMRRKVGKKVVFVNN